MQEFFKNMYTNMRRGDICPHLVQLYFTTLILHVCYDKLKYFQNIFVYSCILCKRESNCQALALIGQ